MNILSRIRNSVSTGAKLSFATILGAALAGITMLSLPSFDKVLDKADTLRKKAANPAIRTLIEENRANTEKLVHMGGPRIKVVDYIDFSGPDKKVEYFINNRENTLVLDFSETAAKAYAAKDPETIRQVETILHSETNRKILAHPYPVLTP